MTPHRNRVRKLIFSIKRLLCLTLLSSIVFVMNTQFCLKISQSYTVGFWGDINFFHEHWHDIPPMKIYNVGVCLVQFLKFFMEPFWRNCNFKILTLNPGFSALKCKNPLKSTIFIHFGHAIWQIRTIFHQKKDSGLILTALSEKNGEKCISS